MLFKRGNGEISGIPNWVPHTVNKNIVVKNNAEKNDKNTVTKNTAPNYSHAVAMGPMERKIPPMDGLSA